MARRLALNDAVKRKEFVIILNLTRSFRPTLSFRAYEYKPYSKGFVLVGVESHTVRVVIILIISYSDLSATTGSLRAAETAGNTPEISVRTTDTATIMTA